jgi:hypothetical protein
VEAFLSAIEDTDRQEDCRKISLLMQEITGAPAKMWGGSIIGFGDYHYKYASGREGDWFLCGFSPRKQNLTVYIMGYLENFEDILKDLGKYKMGKGCLYIKKLEDVDQNVLEKLITTSIKKLENHPS